MTLVKSQTRLAGSLSLALLMAYGTTAMAQSGPDSFISTTTALTGSVTCSNGAVTPLSVDPSTTNDSGSNESTAGATTVTACGQTIYQASSIDDKSHADDTAVLDDGGGETDAQNVSILGGLVTFPRSKPPQPVRQSMRPAMWIVAAVATLPIWPLMDRCCLSDRIHPARPIKSSMHKLLRRVALVFRSSLGK